MRANKKGRPKADMDIEKLRELRAKGYSFREIARIAGIGKSLVAKTLSINCPLNPIVEKKGE